MAEIIANNTRGYFATLRASAGPSGVAEPRKVIVKAKERRKRHNQKTTLFVTDIKCNRCLDVARAGDGGRLRPFLLKLQDVVDRDWLKKPFESHVTDAFSLHNRLSGRIGAGRDEDLARARLAAQPRRQIGD